MKISLTSHGSKLLTVPCAPQTCGGSLHLEIDPHISRKLLDFDRQYDALEEYW